MFEKMQAWILRSLGYEKRGDGYYVTGCTEQYSPEAAAMVEERRKNDSDGNEN